MTTISSDILANVLQRYNVPAKQTPAEQGAAALASIQDKITISPESFSVTTDVEDYLPQARDLKKKSFKSVKEYAEYLLMLYMKIRDLKPKPGEIHVKLEEQSELKKALDELDDVELV